MLISAMVGIDSRATMDIDTTLRNYPLNCESAEQIVRQIADVEIDDKISFVIKKTETILDKGIMPSEKVLDFPVDCNTLTGSVNL